MGFHPDRDKNTIFRSLNLLQMSSRYKQALMLLHVLTWYAILKLYFTSLNSWRSVTYTSNSQNIIFVFQNVLTWLKSHQSAPYLRLYVFSSCTDLSMRGANGTDIFWPYPSLDIWILKLHIYDIDIHSYPIRPSWYNLNPNKNLKTNLISAISVLSDPFASLDVCVIDSL
jgi:hypothetical protein